MLEYGGDTRQLAWSCEGGVLEVWDEGDAGLDLFGTSGSASVTVYVPRGAGLEYVDVQADVGSCNPGGLPAEELTLTADLGDASLTDLALGAADLTLDMGSLTLDAVEAEKLTAELDMGDLTGTLSTTEALTATCDMGSISLEGSFRGTTDLTAAMGAVELFSALPRGEYRYDLSADMGTVTVDGAGRGQSVQAGDGANELTVRCGMGDAAVAFGPAANTGDTAVESGECGIRRARACAGGQPVVKSSPKGGAPCIGSISSAAPTAPSTPASPTTCPAAWPPTTPAGGLSTPGAGGRWSWCTGRPARTSPPPSGGSGP